MIWEDDANTSYRKGEKIRIDLYAKSTDGGAPTYNNMYQFTPIGNLSTTYAPENGCILNVIDQSTIFSMTKKWTNMPSGASAGNLKFTYTLMAKFAGADAPVPVASLEKTSLEGFTENFANTVYRTDRKVPLYDLYGRKITYSITEKVIDTIDNTDYTDKIFKPSVAGSTESSITRLYGQ